MNLIFKVDLYIIKYLLDSKQAGIYATGVSIVEKLWLFSGAAGIITFAETANNSKIDDVVKNIKTNLIFTFIGGIVLFFISDIFIKTFFGEKFIDSINVIKILLPGIVLFSVFRVLNGYFSGLGKVKIIIFIFLPVLIINIVLNFLLIPIYGINGAAFSSTISYSLGVIVLFLFFLYYRK
jgi:O-antigen/teichoic acid export membrane protein